MGPNLLADFFTVSFWFGAAATVLTFVFGVGGHGSSHLPHVGIGTAHGLSGVHVHAGPTISPFNLSSLMAFLVVFGAVGLLLPSGVGALLVFRNEGTGHACVTAEARFLHRCR